MIRNKSGLNRFSPVYMVHLEAGSRFIMSAKVRCDLGSGAIMGIEQPTRLHRNAPRTAPVTSSSPWTRGPVTVPARTCWASCEATLCATRTGTARAVASRVPAPAQVGSEYTIFDRGLNPAKTAVETQARRELGVIMFEYDKMGPGHIQVGTRAPCLLPGRACSFPDSASRAGGRAWLLAHGCAICLEAKVGRGEDFRGAALGAARASVFAGEQSARVLLPPLPAACTNLPALRAAAQVG